MNTLPKKHKIILAFILITILTSVALDWLDILIPQITNIIQLICILIIGLYLWDVLPIKKKVT